MNGRLLSAGRTTRPPQSGGVFAVLHAPLSGDHPTPVCGPHPMVPIGVRVVLLSESRVERLQSKKGGVMSGWVILAWLGVTAITILRVALIVGLVAIAVLVVRGVWRYHLAQPMS